MKDGDCIGGFTKAQWESVSGRGKFVVDSDSFLFNLSSSRQFTNTDEGGIYCRRSDGPNFGNKNYYELAAFEPFNGEFKCGSWVNNDGYNIEDDECGKNMMTNERDGSFTISELEVWEVINVENLFFKRQSNCSNQ